MGAAGFLGLAALAAGCGKTSAGDPAAGGMQAMPVQVQVAKSQKIPDATEYLVDIEVAAFGYDQSSGRGPDHEDICEVGRPRNSGNAAFADRSVEAASHG